MWGILGCDQKVELDGPCSELLYYPSAPTKRNLLINWTKHLNKYIHEIKMFYLQHNFRLQHFL